MKRKINYISIPKQGNTSAIMIMSKAGARFEQNEHKGVSHFVEHMCFKGTKKRTQKQISEGIEKYGADLNAFTGWEITAYWAKIANKYRTKALDVLKDFVMNPLIPENEVEKERNVILQELKMLEDLPPRKIFDYVNEVLYGFNSGFSLPEVGTKQSLEAINRKILYDYHKKNYDDLTIIQVGDIKEKQYNEDFNLIAKFEKVKHHKQNKFYFHKRDIEQSSVAISNYIALPAIKRIDRYFAFEILHSIFSDMSGRLFQIIREKNNLVYRIHFHFQVYSCGGIQWWVTLGLDEKNINKAYDMIVKELTRSISKKEINYAIVKLLGSKKMNLDNPCWIVETIADCLINKIDYKKMIYNYEKSYKGVGELINQYQDAINFKNNVLVAITPEKNNKKVI